MNKHMLTIAAILAYSPAAMADSVMATASAQIVERLTISSKEPLNFGHLTPVGAGGSVTLNVLNQRSATGGVKMSGSFGRARFEVQGTPSKSYSIHTPASQQFVSSHADVNHVNSLIVHDFTTMSQNNGAGGTGKLNASGTDSIYLGGTIDVPANAMPGIYSGLVPITVSY